MFQRLRDQLFGVPAGPPSTSTSPSSGPAGPGIRADTGGESTSPQKLGYRPYHSSTTPLPANQDDLLSRPSDAVAWAGRQRQAPHHRSRMARPASAVGLDALGKGVSSDATAVGAARGMRHASSSFNLSSSTHLSDAEPLTATPQQQQQQHGGARIGAPSAAPNEADSVPPAVRVVRAGAGGASGTGYSPPVEVPFRALLEADVVDMRRLRELSWHGVPVPLRRDVWCLLTGHWHPQRSQREAIVARKRQEYLLYVRRSYTPVDWDAVCAAADSTGGMDGVGALRWRPGGGEPAGLGVVARARGLRTSLSMQSLLSAQQGAVPDGAAAGPYPTGGRRHSHGHEGTESDSERMTAGGASSPSSPSHSPLEARREGVGHHARLPPSTSSLHGRPHHLQRPPVQGPPAPSDTSAMTPAVPRIPTGAIASSAEVQIIKQIRKDIPRMSGGVAWLQHPRVRATLERVLFIWSLRHPACGYVQGMNDFVVPFLAVILAHRYCATKSVSELYSYDESVAQERFGAGHGDVESDGGGAFLEHGQQNRQNQSDAAQNESQGAPQTGEPEREIACAMLDDTHKGSGSFDRSTAPRGNVPEDRPDSVNDEDVLARAGPTDPLTRNLSAPTPTDDTYIQKRSIDSDDVWMGELEADTYWLTAYVLSVMQDNYTQQQRGITAMVRRLEAVLAAADAAFYKHLTQTLNIEISLFAFRWINCLLLRELTVTQSLRLFDTYLSDENRDWSTSHVFVCCALLLRLSHVLVGTKDFAAALSLLQNPPTERLTAKDINEVISESYVLQCLYANVTVPSTSTAMVGAASSDKPNEEDGNDTQPKLSSSTPGKLPQEQRASYAPARFSKPG